MYKSPWWDDFSNRQSTLTLSYCIVGGIYKPEFHLISFDSVFHFLPLAIIKKILPWFLFEPSMAEAVVFDLADSIIGKFSSLTLPETDRWWNVKDDPDDLRNTVSSIKAKLPDTGELSATSNFTAWLKKSERCTLRCQELARGVIFRSLEGKPFPFRLAKQYCFSRNVGSNWGH